MSDLFHEKLTDHEIARVFATMAQAPRHTFQILTKRPERMLRFFMAMSLVETPVFLSAVTDRWPLSNVWLGVSVEDQATADERIPLLLKTPAAVHFVSYEPALAEVDFRRFVGPQRLIVWPPEARGMERGIDWLIIGGESGHGARPFDLAWARSAIAQCEAAGVAAFVKQRGARPIEVDPDGRVDELRLESRKGGDMAEWPEDLRVREFPNAADP